MNFQDNLEKVRDPYVVLSFLSIREVTLYFLVHYEIMEHHFFFILLSIFLVVSGRGVLQRQNGCRTLFQFRC